MITFCQNIRYFCCTDKDEESDDYSEFCNSDEELLVESVEVIMKTRANLWLNDRDSDLGSDFSFYLPNTDREVFDLSEEFSDHIASFGET